MARKGSERLTRHVIFSHGLNSSPFSQKIQALNEIAESEGYHVAAVDYRGVDDPQGRARLLADFCKELEGDLVLVGSSLGAWVSLAAGPALRARGYFLMAPAIEMPGLPALPVLNNPGVMTLIHGWQDEIVPHEHSLKFARTHNARLHLVHSDHGLHSAIPVLRYLFQYFLIELDLPKPLE